MLLNIVICLTIIKNVYRCLYEKILEILKNLGEVKNFGMCF